MRTKRKTTMLLALTTVFAMAACDDTPTDPGVNGENNAVVEGEVEETTPSSNPATGPQRAPGTAAQTVSVVQIGASGEYSELASADVQANGTYRIENVPSGRTNTAVVAYVDGRAAGEVLIHGEIRSNATVRPAPITYETTMETRTYARIVASGRTDATSTSELALLLRAQGDEILTALESDAELGAIADGSAEAGATMSNVFADANVSLNASARSSLLVDAAADLVANLLGGVSIEVAHEQYADAAIDAYVNAGARLYTVVMATAAAANNFDAQVNGRSSVRGRVITQPVMFNLIARQRAAAEYSGSAEAMVASAVESSIESGRAGVETATTAAEIKSALEANLAATIDATADAAVELLAANADAFVRANVRAAAEAALDEATLSTRLQSTSTASASSSAMADYRASVRAAVQAMVEAAGNTTADVDVMTDLFIAACGGAYIR